MLDKISSNEQSNRTQAAKREVQTENDARANARAEQKAAEQQQVQESRQAAPAPRGKNLVDTFA